MRERPRSRREIVLDAVEPYRWLLWGFAFLYFASHVLMGTSILVHVYVAEIGVLSSYEAEVGLSLSERFAKHGPWYTLAVLGLVAAGAGASLRETVRCLYD